MAAVQVLAVIGLGLYAGSLFVVWLSTLAQSDQTRNNVATYGVSLGLATVLLIATYVRQEVARRRIASRSAAAQAARL